MPEITRGVIAALLTPFQASGSIDWELLAAHASFAESAGVHAVCVGGIASELAGATPNEFGSVCRAVCSAVRIPVWANIYPDSTVEAIELAQAAAGAGVAVLLVAQPHYLFQPGAEALADMLRELRRHTKLPLMMANTVRTAMLSTPAIRRLMERGVIEGVVQGGGEAHILADLLCLPERPPVYSAIDELAYLGHLLGADGTLSTLAAVFPAECVRVYTAHAAGDHETARRMHNRLLRVWRILDHPAELLARLKLAATVTGSPAGVARSPYQISSAECGAIIRGVLQQEQMLG